MNLNNENMEPNQKELENELNEALSYADKKVDSLQLRIVNASATKKNHLMRTIAGIMREKELMENKLQEIGKQSENRTKEIENSRQLIKESKARIDDLIDNIQNPLA